MAKKKPAKPDYRAGRFLNLAISVETHAEIGKLARLLGREDPLGTPPSLHRAMAVAVREALDRRKAK